MILNNAEIWVRCKGSDREGTNSLDSWLKYQTHVTNVSPLTFLRSFFLFLFIRCQEDIKTSANSRSSRKDSQRSAVHFTLVDNSVLFTQVVVYCFWRGSQGTIEEKKMADNEAANKSPKEKSSEKLVIPRSATEMQRRKLEKLMKDPVSC